MTRTITRLALSTTLAAALLGSVILPSGNRAKADDYTTGTPAPWTYNPGTPGTYTNTGGTPGTYTYTPGYLSNSGLICKIIGC